MPIDIDALTESELIDLNHRIVARLRFLRQLHAHATMLEFRIGERVTCAAPRATGKPGGSNVISIQRNDKHSNK